MALREHHVHDDGSHRDVVLREGLDRLLRLPDRQAFGDHDEHERRPAGVGEDAARLLKPVAAFLQRPQERVIVEVVRLGPGHVLPHPREGAHLAPPLDEPADPRRHQLRQREQPQRLAGGRRVEHDPVVGAAFVLEDPREAVEEGGLHGPGRDARDVDLPVDLAEEPRGRGRLHARLDGLDVAVCLPLRVDLHGPTPLRDLPRPVPELRLEHVAGGVRRVGGHEKRPAPARGHVERGHGRHGGLSDAALAAEEENRPVGERQRGLRPGPGSARGFGRAGRAVAQQQRKPPSGPRSIPTRTCHS